MKNSQNQDKLRKILVLQSDSNPGFYDRKPRVKPDNHGHLLLNLFYFYILGTLESVIDIGQGITVGPRKFVKKNKRRALNKRRAPTKCANLCYKNPSNLKISVEYGKNSKI